MKKSQRLKVIVNLYAENEKKALEALGQVQKEKQNALTQLENLLQYQQEYINNHNKNSEKRINIQKLIEFRAFISKLDKAIDEQKSEISQMEKKILLARKNWEMHHHKTNGIEKVCDGAAKEEMKIEEKREQNEQDDRATRLGGKNGTGNALI
ncbi:MAG: flagellar export protein FliJ [Methylococcaceae bacterium]|nr:flagellar export protein FliJ [Methylococcaceae bacterium]